jgi:tetratricopeptide (TPR) repeat protein
VLLDRSRRLLLTTFEVVTRDQPLTVIFPIFQAGRPVAEVAFYREQHRLLQAKGVQVQGCVLASDARRNLALVELATVPDGVEDVKFAATSPAPGEPLHALGHPLRMEVLWVYTAASVRQLGHANLGQTRDGPDPAVLILQAPLGEGDGGGPLLNDRGELVGIVSGKSAPQQQISFGLLFSEIQAFLVETRPHWKPQTALEWCQRGVLFTRARQYERAIGAFTDAIRLDPAYAPAYSERAWAHHLRGVADLALADCDKALQLDPRLGTAYCHRAAALCSMGQLTKAIADCDTALRLDPSSARAYWVRGHAHLLQGDADRAVLDCDEAIWLDRRLPEAHLYRGQSFAHKGDHDRAIADYTQALRLDPRLAEAFRCRGDSYWARSDVPASLADHDQALGLDPHDARAYLGRGRALAARSEVDRAVAAYIRALQLQPRLLADALTEVERRVGELARGGAEDVARGCDLCRGVLLAVEPLLKDRADVQTIIAKGLAAAEREMDLGERVLRLSGVLAEVRKNR